MKKANKNRNVNMAIGRAAKVFGKTFDQVKAVYYKKAGDCPKDMKKAYNLAHYIASKYENAGQNVAATVATA